MKNISKKQFSKYDIMSSVSNDARVNGAIPKNIVDDLFYFLMSGEHLYWIPK